MQVSGLRATNVLHEDWETVQSVTYHDCSCPRTHIFFLAAPRRRVCDVADLSVRERTEGSRVVRDTPWALVRVSRARYGSKERQPVRDLDA